MDSSRLRQIHEENADKAMSSERHTAHLRATVQVSDTVLSATSSLIKYLEGHTTKTQVVNQLKTIGTPDALKVIPEIKALHETLKNRKSTDLSEVTRLMQGILDESKKIPKELPKAEKQQFVDYTKQFAALSEAIKAVGEIVKAQELVAEAPIVNVPETKVNVAAPDLKPLQTGLKDVVSAVKKIVIPEHKTDNKAVEKLLTASNKLLKGILEKPVSSGGGGGGRATPYQDSAGVPAFVELDNGAIPVTSGGVASYQVNDIEEATTSYFGFSTTAGDWLVKELTDTSVAYATVSNNGTVTSYTDAWTDRATLTYGRFDEAF